MIRLEISDAVALVTLDRDEARNALSDEMRRMLHERLVEVAGNTAVRALVLTGAGRAFCAGGDLATMRARLQQPAGAVAGLGLRRQIALQGALEALQTIPIPTIAAVNGAASGLGCDLALSCDFILAAESASFHFGYAARGLLPDGNGLYTLPRRVGVARAKDLIFAARKVGAIEALAMGLADRVVPDNELVPAARAWAGEFRAQSGPATSLAKLMLGRSFESGRDAVALGTAEGQAMLYTTDEHRSAINGRKPER